MLTAAEIPWVSAPLESDDARRTLPSKTATSADDRSHVFQAATRFGVSSEALTLGGEPSTAVTVDDFYALMPMHGYIYTPTRELWPASSVNARIAPVATVTADGKPVKVKAATWLDQHRPVEQMTWMPGEPMTVCDRLVSEGGWLQRPGCRVFNLYRPPVIAPGDPGQATRWLQHLGAVYPDDRAHIVLWLAHRVQRPHQKINHGLVLGGVQGVGKDTILEPVKAAVGPWNFVEVSPAHLLGRFNGFIKSVILRISEARDLGDVDRYSFYDHLKVFTAAPPDVLRVDEKNLREYSVFNVTGVVITTNHKDGLYLPPDDRRHYVAWSDKTAADFGATYFHELYAWYRQEGARHVAAYLQHVDLSSFDPKASPLKTDAWHAVVNANRAPEDAELADALDALGTPVATTITKVIAHASAGFGEWLRDRRNARQIPHRMEAAGYVAVRNPAAISGLWVVAGRRQMIYARVDLTVHDRFVAAQAVVGGQQ
jgi:hypothetical protein